MICGAICSFFLLSSLLLFFICDSLRDPGYLTPPSRFHLACGCNWVNGFVYDWFLKCLPRLIGEWLMGIIDVIDLPPICLRIDKFGYGET